MSDVISYVLDRPELASSSFAFEQAEAADMRLGTKKKKKKKDFL